MNINDISTQLIYTTVPIYVKKGEQLSSATGFIFSIKETEQSYIPLLITNYHVLENADAGFIEIHTDLKEDNNTVQIQFDKTIISNNKLGELDLIAIPLAGTLNDFSQKGINLFYRTVDQTMIPNDEQINEFSTMEEIVFIGYPSGLYDNVNKLPILRRGITATPIWNNFKGKDNFLIDAGVFPGSSGSPVFIYNQGSFPTKNGIAVGSRLLFVGVISETMLTGNGSNYLNLGVVINSKVMFYELDKFINKLKSNT